VEPGIFSIWPALLPSGDKNGKGIQSLTGKFPLPLNREFFSREPGINSAEPGIVVKQDQKEIHRLVYRKSLKNVPAQGTTLP
jgi:hypothetical protein